MEDTAHQCCGYMDNICFYRTSKSLQENARRLEGGDPTEIQCSQLGQKDKVAIDPDKSELPHLPS